MDKIRVDTDVLAQYARQMEDCADALAEARSDLQNIINSLPECCVEVGAREKLEGWVRATDASSSNCARTGRGLTFAVQGYEECETEIAHSIDAITQSRENSEGGSGGKGRVPIPPITEWEFTPHTGRIIPNITPIGPENSGQPDSVPQHRNDTYVRPDLKDVLDIEGYEPREDFTWTTDDTEWIENRHKWKDQLIKDAVDRISDSIPDNTPSDGKPDLSDLFQPLYSEEEARERVRILGPTNPPARPEIKLDPAKVTEAFENYNSGESNGKLDPADLIQPLYSDEEVRERVRILGPTNPPAKPEIKLDPAKVTEAFENYNSGESNGKLNPADFIDTSKSESLIDKMPNLGPGSYKPGDSIKNTASEFISRMDSGSTGESKSMADFIDTSRTVNVADQMPTLGPSDGPKPSLSSFDSAAAKAGIAAGLTGKTSVNVTSTTKPISAGAGIAGAISSASASVLPGATVNLGGASAGVGARLGGTSVSAGVSLGGTSVSAGVSLGGTSVSAGVSLGGTSASAGVSSAFGAAVTGIGKKF